jgi:hypothetical protein
MKRMIPIGALLLIALFGLWGCENDTTNDLGGPGGTVQTSDMTCIGCHSSETMLKETLGEVAGAKVAVPFKDDG